MQSARVLNNFFQVYSIKHIVWKIKTLAIAKVKVSDKLDVNISSGGNVEYSGNPSITRNISSGGSLKDMD